MNELSSTISWREEKEAFYLCERSMDACFRKTDFSLAVTSLKVARERSSSISLAMCFKTPSLAYGATGNRVSSFLDRNPGLSEIDVCENELSFSVIPESTPSIHLAVRWQTCDPSHYGEKVLASMDTIWSLRTDQPVAAVECMAVTQLQVEEPYILLPDISVARTVNSPGSILEDRPGRTIFSRDRYSSGMIGSASESDPGETWSAPAGMMPLIVFRLPGNQISYVELFQLEDVSRLILESTPDDETGMNGGKVSCQHALFGRDLERGVVLRARLRRIWLTREADLEFAQQCGACFLEEPPALNT